MLHKIINALPRDLLAFLYKHVPFTKLKNWVVYRAQHKFLVAVLGVFTNPAGQVLLLKHTYRSEPWGIPGGWMELERPEDGLIREVVEETGLNVEIIGLAKALYNKNPNRVDLIFKGRIVGGTFTSSQEIADMMFCDSGNWPTGLPHEQKVLIESVLDTDKRPPK